jgi:peptidoglycan/LPS O-acetylase OafA/YrhL
VLFRSIEALPFLLWFGFFGMLLDLCGNQKSIASWLAPWFNHPSVLYLGKISYSIYLSHTLVMIVCHSLVLNFLDGWSQASQAGVLAFLTGIVTLVLSHFLYKYIERPGMRFGRRFAK